MFSRNPLCGRVRSRSRSKRRLPTTLATIALNTTSSKPDRTEEEEEEAAEEAAAEERMACRLRGL
jgi:hypothetical protein